jgi:hypothetical protein
MNIMIETILASNGAFKVYSVLFAISPIGIMAATGETEDVIHEGSGIALGMAMGAIGTVAMGAWIVRGWVDKIEILTGKVDQIMANQCPAPGLCHEIQEKLIQCQAIHNQKKK